MALTHHFWTFILGSVLTRQALAVRYCYCEGSPGFWHLGIEQVCKSLGSQWQPVNCDLGSSDLCKYTGNGGPPEDSLEALNDWCESSDRRATNFDFEFVQGGSIHCEVEIPDGTTDDCPALGQAGYEKDEDIGKIDLDEEAPDSPNRRKLFHRGLLNPSTSQYLLYRPAEPLIPPILPHSNILRTSSIKETKNYDHDHSSETIYQINELRILGWEWRKLKSYDNIEGDSDYTESIDIAYGLETSSGADLKASLSINMGYSGFGAKFGVDASVSTQFFSSKKESLATKKTEKFRVPKGSAAHLYQKIYQYESKAYFRLVSKGDYLDFEGKNARGAWTLGYNEDEPVEVVVEFEVAADEKVLKRSEISGRGTFDVADKFQTKKPLFSKEPIFPKAGWSRNVQDYFTSRNFKI